jgi:hypothetical protein
LIFAICAKIAYWIECRCFASVPTNENSCDLDFMDKYSVSTIQFYVEKCVSSESLLLSLSLITCHHLLEVEFVGSLRPNFCPGLTRWNTADNNSINSHAQDTVALQANIILTGIHRFMAMMLTNIPVSKPGKCWDIISSV